MNPITVARELIMLALLVLVWRSAPWPVAVMFGLLWSQHEALAAIMRKRIADDVQRLRSVRRRR